MKARAAIIGPGNIGTDLLAKLQRSEAIEVQYVVGVVESDGLQRARSISSMRSSRRPPLRRASSKFSSAE